MNENIARESNREDRCKGRFWEGRFKSQALLDEGALLTCMTYVDLNPIRAGMCEKPEESDYTSIQERIHQYWSKTQQKPKKLAQYQAQQEYLLGKGLMKFAGKHPTEQTVLPISRKEYFELLDWTGRILRKNKKGKIPDKFKPILQRLELDETQWIESLKTFRHRFFSCHRSFTKITQLCSKKENKLGERSRWREEVISARTHTLDRKKLI